MSIPITFNGVNYDIPEFRDTDYANDLTNFFVAIPNGVLQPAGGMFTLLSEVDFGSGFGIKSLYFKSRTANPASAGNIRLASGDSLAFRNFANSGNLLVSTNASDQLTFDGTNVLTGASPSAYVSSITGTADQVIASASTGPVTLSLPQSIGLTSAVRFASLALGAALDASSILSMSSTTKGFLPPRMTQAQRDAIATPSEGLIVYNTDSDQINYYNGVSWVALAAGGSGSVGAGLQNQLAYYAANGTAVIGLTSITASRALASDTNGLPVASVTTAAELAFVSGVTSTIQSQINNKLSLSGGTLTGSLTISTGGLDVTGGIVASTGNIEAPRGSFSSGGISGFAGRLDLLQNPNTATGSLRMVPPSAGNGVVTITPSGNAVNRNYTIPSVSADTDFLLTGESQTVTGAKTFASSSLLLQEAAGSDVITIAVASLAAARIYTMPDAGTNASFVMTEGVQTLNGAKTFSSLLTAGAGITTGSTIASDTDNTDDFGTTGINFKDLYMKGDVKVGSTTAIDLASSGAVSIRGTATNDNAASGFVGEYIESVNTATTSAAASTQYNDVASISLTAGDWDVTVQGYAETNGATYTDIEMGISSSSGNAFADRNSGGSNFWHYKTASTSTISTEMSGTIAGYRISLNATTTYYFKQQWIFSAGTPRMRGRISARRVR